MSIITSGVITNKYGWELCLFMNIRRCSDGVSFMNFNVDWDRYDADHKPSFRVYFGLFNFTVLEFQIYNIYHKDDDYESV